MKALALLALLSAPHFALADETDRSAHAYWCTADGYDYADRVRSISGDLKPTRKAAEDSALRTCRGLFTACQLRSCFQQR